MAASSRGICQPCPANAVSSSSCCWPVSRWSYSRGGEAKKRIARASVLPLALVTVTGVPGATCQLPVIESQVVGTVKNDRDLPRCRPNRDSGPKARARTLECSP